MASSVSITFLRPMFLPRATALQRFLGGSSSGRSSLSQTLIRKASTSTTSPAAPSPSPSCRTRTPASPTAPTKPYLVHRTASNKMPIYHLTKRGGNKKLTRVRKIEGDVDALRADLQAALRLGDKEVIINYLTRHIIIKGHMKSEVEMFFVKIQQ